MEWEPELREWLAEASASLLAFRLLPHEDTVRKPAPETSIWILDFLDSRT